jgi:hypothetical protein
LPPLIPKETKRLTALASELKSIFKFVTKRQIGEEKKEPGPPKTACLKIWGDIVLTEERATLKVSAPFPPAAAAKADEKTEPPSFNVITGSNEHFFISGDVIVDGAKQLKYDSDTKSITEKDKPNQIYLGINYMLGDLYSPADALSKDRIIIKGLLSPSKKPFDSFGIGLGYRFAEGIFDPENKANSGFVVFVGSFWTKSDQLDGQTVSTDSTRKQSWRVGIGYSLGAALDWLK